MSFRNITASQMLLKEAGVVGNAIGKAVGLPFRAAGAGLGLAGKATAKAVGAGAKGAHRGMWNLSQRGAEAMGAKGVLKKPVGALIYGGTALGGIAAAKHGISKSRQYRQGFDPNYQVAQTYGYGK